MPGGPPCPVHTAPDHPSYRLQPQKVTVMKYILLVDSNPYFRLLGCDLLEWFGYRVEPAKDGLEALALIRQEVPDLVIYDLAMPGFDGYQFIERLRDTGEHSCLPIIVLTARAEFRRRQKAMRAGANAFITKPFDEAKLVHLIETLTWQAGKTRRLA